MKVIDNVLYDVDNNDLKDGILTIPDYITEILDLSFLNAFDMKELVIPKSINKISPSIFENCTLLEKINFKSSIFRINIYEDLCDFFNLPKLEKIIIYNSELTKPKGLDDSLMLSKRHLEIMESEILDMIYDIVKVGHSKIDKNEVLNTIKASKSICNYINKIISSIMNFEDYEYGEDIILIASAIREICCVNDEPSIKIYQKIS